MHRKLIHVAVLGALAATATPASALDFVWNGGTANWSPGTWSQAGLPGAADNVFIDNGNLTNSVVSLNVGATINDLNISSGDSLGVNNNQSLTTLGNVSNNGNLGLNSVGNTTDLRIGSTTTFSGTGTLTLSNHAQNRIFGNSGSTTEVLTNASGHTIQGAGQLGVNQMGLSNQGLVVANQSNALTIDLSDGAGITRTNTGTLRAAGGQLTITGSNLNNAGGVIDAVGTNVVINASTITNGTLQSSGGGKILVQGSSNLSNVSNSGQTEIANAQAGVLTGTFTNTGNLQMASAGNQTDLRLNGDVTLAGAGTLTMSNNAQNRIIGNSGATTEVLTNASGHTIQGAGQLGANQTRPQQPGLDPGQRLGRTGHRCQPHRDDQQRHPASGHGCAHHSELHRHQHPEWRPRRRRQRHHRLWIDHQRHRARLWRQQDLFSRIPATWSTSPTVRNWKLPMPRPPC